MSMSTLFIFLAGFLGGLYVLRLVFEKPAAKKTDPKKNSGHITPDDPEAYSFGSEEKKEDRGSSDRSRS